MFSSFCLSLTVLRTISFFFFPHTAYKRLARRRAYNLKPETLNFESHHPLIHKLGVVRTLLDRMDVVVTEPEDKKTEEKNISAALKQCGYPSWTIKEVMKNRNNKTSSSTKKRNNTTDKKKGQVVIPYIKGLSERIARTLRTHGVTTAFKPHKTIRRLLVHPKDKMKCNDVCGCVYQINCANCEHVYIGETARKFGTRLGEHRSDVDTNSPQGVSTRTSRFSSSGTIHKSAITDHVVDNNHVIDWDNSKIVCKESVLLDRQIRESMTIRKQNKTMNRDEGSYQLSTTYNNLLRPRRIAGGPRPQ